MGTTKIRKVDIKAVASEELNQQTIKDLEQKDPDHGDAREIIRLCGQDFRYTGPTV